MWCDAQDQFEHTLKESSIDAAVLADFHSFNNFREQRIRRWDESAYPKSFFEERVEEPHVTSAAQPGASLADLVKNAAEVHDPVLAHCHYLIFIIFGLVVKCFPLKIKLLCAAQWGVLQIPDSTGVRQHCTKGSQNFQRELGPLQERNER
jgi:hypothetical protein